ncbi:MAG TPA: glycosyltransferase family 39 protein [Thermomonospora sp.]|nr:glycosyltransferase family 39 protein [Thermomonospora sp.]
MLGLLAATALLYLWDLGSSGHANDYYAAAVQAGAQDWKALFFGSLDPANGITVDKPPASLWVMGLSGRIFGFSSWSMLVPQALAGVASVGLLYATVRRWSGAAAGLFAGAAFALTPVATSIFRFNKPDALLTLLLVAAAYCTVRATETGGARWPALAGCALGFGFLTKMLAAFLVMPALALVYLVAAPAGVGRRLARLGVSGVAVVVSAGWYIAVVDLWPAGSRPYIAGSADNTLLDLTLGYNGLRRVFGGGGPAGRGGTGGAAAGGGFSGEPGLARMFNQQFGGEISWLLPAALIGLVAGLWLTRRAARTDRTRAALVLWGGWTLGVGLVFSLMKGIILPYYAVILAPAVAALTGVTGGLLWERRKSVAARCTLAAMIMVTAGWAFVLLGRATGWLPWLRWTLLAFGVLTAVVVAVGLFCLRRTAVVVLSCAIVAALAGTGAYALVTATVPRPDVPTSGPASAAHARSGPPGRTARDGTPTGRGAAATTARGQAAVNTQLVAALRATTQQWAAATVAASGSAGLQLASGKAVMTIGGFAGLDPWPALEVFQRYVAEGRIRYFIPRAARTSAEGATGGGSAAQAITRWVQATYRPTTIGGQTVYDLIP